MKWILTLFFVFQYLAFLVAQSQGETPPGDSTAFRISNQAFCGPAEERSREEKQEEADLFLAWQQAASKQSKAPTTRTLPIVIHLLEDVPGISDEAVVNAVASLNNAYTHSQKYPNGGDFSIGTRGVDTEIEFCLAQRAPDGGLTNGIVRWETDYARMDVDLEDAKLKTQGQWDPRRYLNIWVVSSGIDTEIDQSYRGSTSWDRDSGLGGYSGGPGGVVGPDAPTDGVIVVGLGAALVAHENGHYLSLAHTFAGGCSNNDCLVDGDGICDTPPDNSRAGCNQNSCDTDTLSNYSNGFFPTDVPDMTSNFMDYSSCPNEFTQGQADKMHFVIDNYRNQLAIEAPSNNDACNRPCTADFNISFDINERYREPNVPYDFTSSITGTDSVDTYEWYVERMGSPSFNYSIAWLEGYAPSTSTVATTPDLTHTFSETGKFRVYLKAWNSADPDCYTSYSRTIRVTCLAIDARFTPNVRFIAAKQPGGKMIDSVLFTNRSVNATSFEWTVVHEPYDSMAPAQPDFFSDSTDLNHTFLEPGDYFITLIARNGAMCTDTMGPFKLPVVDPTIDGHLRINRVDCYREDSLRVSFRMDNYGYDTIRVGMPVTFFDEDPRSATPAPTVLGTYYLDEVVYGKDDRVDFVAIVPASKPKLDQVWAVFNADADVPIPITWPASDLNVMSVNSEFPPTGFNELNYGNNQAGQRDFQFRANLEMVDDVACKFTEVRLRAGHSNGRDLTGIEWLPATGLSCDDCLEPALSLQDVDRTQMLVLTSEYFCKDTVSLMIPVIKQDIPLPTVSDPADFCRQADQIDVTTYVSGQQLSWYDSPSDNSGRFDAPDMPINTPGTFSHWVSQTISGCEGPRAPFTYTVVELPAPPSVTPTPNLCEGETAPDLASFVTGPNIIWYDQETGGTGSNQTPAISTAQAGTFQHWISSADATCESERVLVSYTVIDVSAPPQVLPPTNICFGDAPPDLTTRVPGTDLLWYPSETGGASRSTAPNIDTNTPGTYSVWVSQTSTNCESPRAEVTYTVQPEVQPPTITDPADQCRDNGTLNLSTYATGQQLSWYVDQDTLVATDAFTAASLDTTGTFTFWISQTENNCESERLPLQYTVHPVPDTPAVADLIDFCAGGTVPNLARAVSGDNLRWYSNATAGTSADTPPAINSAAPGIYTNWVSQTVAGCESERAEVSFIINPIPSAPQVQQPQELCVGTAAPDLDAMVTGTDIRWYQNRDGGSGSNTIPIATTDVPGSYGVWVSQTLDGCESPRAEVPYKILPTSPLPQVVADLPDICAGAQAHELGGAVAGMNLQWYNEPTGGVGTSTVPTTSSESAQVYSFWVSQSENGCESPRVEVGFVVNAIPEAPDLMDPTDLCVGDPSPDLAGLVTGEGLRWHASANADSGSIASPLVYTDVAQAYQFWVNQNISGCAGPRIPISLTVAGIDAVPGGPYEVVEGNSQAIEVGVSTFPANTSYTIEWTDETGMVMDSDSTTLVVSPTEPTYFTALVVTDNCLEEVDVEVDLIYLIDPTQIFSPNGDGLNETWYIDDIEEYPNADVTVFNRWGSVVYQTSQYQNDWPGTWKNGEPLPVATYYFVIDLKRAGTEVVTGSVTIVR
ncbi:Ig-like domain-containing protein [Neolewinella persica]|uniref:Ig-like domain-containing protein n=1 Tax=Neolewinella persica TaxID=70998 RepID=UPI00037CFB4C|nr:gliding motility-associated C-terminal domain-containing protein [Neolewinella persica]